MSIYIYVVKNCFCFYLFTDKTKKGDWPDGMQQRGTRRITYKRCSRLSSRVSQTKNMQRKKTIFQANHNQWNA